MILSSFLIRGVFQWILWSNEGGGGVGWIDADIQDIHTKRNGSMAVLLLSYIPYQIRVRFDKKAIQVKLKVLIKCLKAFTRTLLIVYQYFHLLFCAKVSSKILSKNFIKWPTIKCIAQEAGQKDPSSQRDSNRDKLEATIEAK